MKPFVKINYARSKHFIIWNVLPIPYIYPFIPIIFKIVTLGPFNMTINLSFIFLSFFLDF